MALIGVISNPRSRKNKRRPERLRQLMEFKDPLVLSRCTETLDDLERALEEFHRRRIEVLAINGGDGTIHLVLTKMFKIWDHDHLPKIAVLKGGTINQVAVNCKVRGNAVSHLKRLVAKLRDKKPFRIVRKPLFRIDDKYGFIFGNGIVTAFMDYYYKDGDPSPYIAFRTLVSSVSSIVFRTKLYRELFAGFEGRLVVDGADHGTREYLGVFITSLSKIGLGFEPFWQNRRLTDRMQMLAFPKGARIIPYLGLAWLGRPLPRDMALNAVGKDFLIEARRPFKYTIDGDFYQSDGSVRVLVERTIDIVAG